MVPPLTGDGPLIEIEPAARRCERQDGTTMIVNTYHRLRLTDGPDVSRLSGKDLAGGCENHMARR